MGRIITPLVLLFALLPAFAQAAKRVPVVDATGAESNYKAGKYREARDDFEAAIDKFRDAPKDSTDKLVYREAAYLYDRTADCCFTMRDWDALKKNLDGLLVVNMSERNFCQGQLAQAVDYGVGRAVAKYLMDDLDESVRLSSLTQLKRSISLVLVDNQGAGANAEAAIKLYQELVGILQKVLIVVDGAFVVDVGALERNMTAIEEIDGKLQKLGDIEALWEKYKPEGVGQASTPSRAAP
jgi:tetratricopeptide (TPR) repeat protein